MARYRNALVPGSHLALSTVTGDWMPAHLSAAMEVVRGTPNEVNVWNHREVVRMFGEFALVEPGVVAAPMWRPERPGTVTEDDARMSNIYAGVARKC
jgi:hypothetical protein